MRKIMEYLSLYKLIYSKPNEFKEIYSQRYNAEDTIHLNINIGQQSAFICSNFEMMHLIEKISYENKIIIDHLNDQNVPHIFTSWMKYHTLVEEIVMTNEIEGVVSTRQEIGHMVEIEKPKQYLKFYGILNKYREIINKETFECIVDSKDVRKLYNKILLQDIKNDDAKNLPDGEFFRKEGVDITSRGRVIHKGITPESNIIENMDIALNFLNDEKYPLLVRVAAFHYFFGYIHPFYDGNGRMSRFISSYYLSEELNEYSALQLAVSIKKNQSSYNQAFKITNDSRNQGDLTYFVIVFLEILLSGLKDFENSISDSLDMYQYYNSKLDHLQSINNIAKDILRFVLQASLFDMIECDAKFISDNISRSIPTVNKYLSILEDKDYIFPKKKGKKKIYIFHHEIFDQ